MKFHHQLVKQERAEKIDTLHDHVGMQEKANDLASNC